MRIFDALLRAGVLSVSLMAAPAFAFDGSKSDDTAALTMTPNEAFRSGAQWLKSGETAKGISAL